MTVFTVLTLATTQPYDVSGDDVEEQLDCLAEVTDMYAEWVLDPSSKLSFGNASAGYITINWSLARNFSSSAKDDVSKLQLFLLSQLL